MNTKAKQLAFVREYLGITQTTLSKSTPGLSQSNLSRFEKGLDIISDDVFVRIVEFLGFPREFYDLNIGDGIEIKHYRKKASVTKKDVNKFESLVRLYGYIIDELFLSLEDIEHRAVPLNIEEGYTPESAAKYTRKSFGIPNGAPVKDIFSLCENMGIIVIEMDAHMKFDGVSLFTDKGAPVIVVNKNYPNDRKRFTIAHELGHLVLHILGQFAIPDYREGKVMEEEANRFASEFLMPAESIKNSLGGLRVSDLATLKRSWYTSMASIVRRAYDLQMIDSNRYQYLNIELSRAGYKKKEPVEVAIDKPCLFESAYMIHKNELGYSDGDLAKAFHLPMETLALLLPSDRLQLRVRRSL